MRNQYQAPTVRTLDARQLLESLGPVSCGSVVYDVQGFSGIGGATPSSGGNRATF